MWKNLSKKMSEMESGNLSIDDVYHFYDKQLCIADGLKVVVEIYAKEKIFRLVATDSDRDLLIINWADVEDCLRKILLMYFYENYSRIKEHLLFRKIYSYAERNILYMRGPLVLSVSENTFPCMQCGLVLPEKNITIDHIHPQSGGELEAVLRCFAACGLTNQELVDDLGSSFLENSQGSFLDLAGNIMDANKWPVIEPSNQISSKSTSFDPAPLNEIGVLILSLLIWEGDFEQTKFNCMNSLLNLRPVCLGCNASKGNRV